MSTSAVAPPLSPEAAGWLAGLPPEVAGQVSVLPTDAIEWLADDTLELEANQRIENGDDPEHAEFVRQILADAAAGLRPGERLELRPGDGLYVVRED